MLAIRIPRLDDPDASVGLQHLVVQQWPSYVAFALTFIVVGTVWANHRLAFSYLVRTDLVLVALNLLEMMSVAFVSIMQGLKGVGLGAVVMTKRRQRHCFGEEGNADYRDGEWLARFQMIYLYPEKIVVVLAQESLNLWIERLQACNVREYVRKTDSKAGD